MTMQPPSPQPRHRPPRLLIATIALAATGFIAWSPHAAAQTGQPAQPSQPGNTEGRSGETTVEPLPKKFWEADLADGNYFVALQSIQFVAFHEYVVDGNVLVREVTVSTNSSAIARFYHIELVAEDSGLAGAGAIVNRATTAAEAIAGRTGAKQVWKMVQKNYPTSTHAHTAEFRVQHLENLNALYGSVKSSWYNGDGAKITIREDEE